VRTVFALPAAIVSFLASSAPALADLKLCNRMSYVVEAAIGIDDKAATATRGWFRIDPAACRVVVQGSLTADRILLNARALGGSGVLHLVRPQVFEWLVPPEVGDARGWVTATGVAEIGTAALLASPVSRRAGGWAAAVLLTAFLPAHVHTFRVVPRRPLPLAAAAVRLPLQAPLVAAALRVARGR
jgi:uncharacterized membrane protein